MKYVKLVIVLYFTLNFLLLPKASFAGKIDELSSMAKQGQIEAQFALAEACYFGNDTEKNLPQAFFWYKKAAQQGHPKAQRALGAMYELGKVTSKEPEKAAYWYQKSAEQGLARAQTNLGILYETGVGVAQHYDTARKWYEKAAAQGYTRGQTNLGRMYELGSGVEVDYKKAFYWYQKAADQNYLRALTNLGALFEAGQGVVQDYAKAMAMYKDAAEQGYARAQFYIGRMFEQGLGVEKDVAQASKWYSQAAALGHVKARVQLVKVKSEPAKTHEKITVETQKVADQVEDEEVKVSIEEKGKETDQVQDTQVTAIKKAKQKEEAVQVQVNKVTVATHTKMKQVTGQVTLKTKDKYLAAAEEGDPKSQNILGQLYLNGDEGYEIDAEEAAYWFSRAAQKGNTAAQNNLALLYFNGEGVEKNIPKGLRLLQKAAYSGNVDAQNNLGMYYLETNYSQAVVWFLKAAKQDLPDAQYSLASMYLAGLGVKQNKEQAIHWMQKAANQGYLIAMKTLDSILEKKPETTKSYASKMGDELDHQITAEQQQREISNQTIRINTNEKSRNDTEETRTAAPMNFVPAQDDKDTYASASKRADKLYQQIIAEQQQRGISNQISRINTNEKSRNDTEETRTAAPMNFVPDQNDKDTYARVTRIQHEIERLTERIESGLSDRDYDRFIQLKNPAFVIHDSERLEAYQAELDKLLVDNTPQ